MQAAFRKHIEEAETEVHGSQPLFVFDNHDNVRAIDRFGDGEHDPQINKLLATVLFTTRATSLMYYGEELGMTTTHANSQRRREGPDRHHRLAEGEGPRRRAHADAVDARTAGGLQHESAYLAADSAELQVDQRADGAERAELATGLV